MGSRQVTDRNAVLLAMDECDRVGRDTFLERYGFGRSHTYVLMHEGRAYDSKAILGVAHKYQYGEPLEAGTFNGGKHETALVLRRLGFEVTGP